MKHLTFKAGAVVGALLAVVLSVLTATGTVDWSYPLKGGLTKGDLLVAKDAANLQRVAAVASGQVLTSAGVGAVPVWSANGWQSGLFNGYGAIQTPTAYTGATATLDPTKNVIMLQCNRSGPADTALTMGETSIPTGSIVHIYVDGSTANAGTCSIADSAGVFQGAATTLDDWDSVSLLYTGGLWVQIAASNN